MFTINVMKKNISKMSLNDNSLVFRNNLPKMMHMEFNAPIPVFKIVKSIKIKKKINITLLLKL